LKKNKKLLQSRLTKINLIHSNISEYLLIKDAGYYSIRTSKIHDSSYSQSIKKAASKYAAFYS
jgi:hypothetical protein